jgi:hypothetical protein
VESLHFREIANSPSFVYLQPSALCFLCPTHRRSCRPCAVHLPPPCRFSLCHVPSCALPAAFPASRWPAPASPRRATVARAATRAAGVASSCSRATPLPALRHAQHLHHYLRYSLKHFFSPAFLFPDHRASPDLRRSACSPSTATHAASHPQSSTSRASLRLPAAH